MTNTAIALPPTRREPPALFTPESRAAKRFMECFTVHIESAHTRRAYSRTACAFSAWCAAQYGIHQLDQVEPMRVAAYITGLDLSTPSKKQHLTALRMLFA